jgi:hypothetical protein
MAKSTQRVQLNLKVSGEGQIQLNDLLERAECTSLTELIRKALALYDLCLEHVREGGEVIFRHSDGEEEKLIIPT